MKALRPPTIAELDAILNGDEAADQVTVQPDDSVVRMVPTKSESEIALDIKRRIEAAMTEHVGPIFDEVAAHGLQIVWAGFAPEPPFFRHKLNNLRVIKTY